MCISFALVSLSIRCVCVFFFLHFFCLHRLLLMTCYGEQKFLLFFCLSSEFISFVDIIFIYIYNTIIVAYILDEVPSIISSQTKFSRIKLTNPNNRHNNDLGINEKMEQQQQQQQEENNFIHKKKKHRINMQ